MTADSLRGKVVLVQFWTYTCIDWLRTLPYVRAWNEKYKGKGLAVVGVHTPEFPFEKDVENVRRALKVMGPAARGKSVRFRVTLDGQPAGAAHGADVDEQGNGTLTEQRLYQLIRQPKPITDRRFEIEFLDPGAEAFAFTFG